MLPPSLPHQAASASLPGCQRGGAVAETGNLCLPPSVPVSSDVTTAALLYFVSLDYKHLDETATVSPLPSVLVECLKICSCPIHVGRVNAQWLPPAAGGNGQSVVQLDVPQGMLRVRPLGHPWPIGCSLHGEHSGWEVNIFLCRRVVMLVRYPWTAGV